MPCFTPLQAWKAKRKNASGKRPVVFDKSQGYADQEVSIPCGQCIGCRLERSRQWAMRCLHEAQLYKENCFITLTYNDENLPEDGSLNKSHFQKFMKRLRKENSDRKIRFFHCGEYGDLRSRPHYHACVFNFSFGDMVPWRIDGENKLYVSKALDRLWGKGFATIGEVNFETAAYTARYILKKALGKNATEKYMEIDNETGEIKREILPEYTTMSRRPGIGAPWLEKFHKDVYPSDEVIVRGKRMKPPKFYDEIMERAQERMIKKLKILRKGKAEKNEENNRSYRLAVREKVKMESIKKLSRRIEK